MLEFRPYEHRYRESCVSVFDSNCPKYLHPDERADFEAWLDEVEGTYLVMAFRDQVIGCGGFVVDAQEAKLSLTWGLVHSDHHGRGCGQRLLVERLLSGFSGGTATWARLATTPQVEAFFGRVGFRRTDHIPNGWGPGMDRVELRLELEPELLSELKVLQRRTIG